VFWLNFDRYKSCSLPTPFTSPITVIDTDPHDVGRRIKRQAPLYLAFPKKDWSFRAEGQGLPGREREAWSQTRVG
jgi:hypothetical protein